MTKAETKQLEMLRAKTPEQRFAMMADLMAAQFEAMKAGIKYQSPGATDKVLKKMLNNRLWRMYLKRNDCSVRTKAFLVKAMKSN